MVMKNKVRKRENVTKKKIAVNKAQKKNKASESKEVITGYRKKAIARGYYSGESGIRVNGKPLRIYFPELLFYRVMEPVYLVGEEKLSSLSLSIKVSGGGINGQGDAVRQVIAKALVEKYGEEVKRKLMEYDRSLLVPDVRQTEPHKPSRSKQGPRRRKQLSKR